MEHSSIVIPSDGKIYKTKKTKVGKGLQQIAVTYRFQNEIHMNRQRVELVRNPTQEGIYAESWHLVSYSVNGKLFALETSGIDEGCGFWRKDSPFTCAISLCGDLLLRYIDTDGDGQFDQILTYPLDRKNSIPPLAIPEWVKETRS